ncbi:type II toxin-antitoxin system RelE/ParE family toxin [Yersinia kristensenii]|uniref:type II toxin-antitoxin system RelE/ParE family toxin n=1 Tax=Yersinia kristensenii TaxID=28152 RepID=UPI0005DCA021|nr:type II toxin-antitoxin system RelE/ParE family toxin [Yersinia kristensenii]CFR05211.1 Phage-related protein [Yersinia kristensenii]
MLKIIAHDEATEEILSLPTILQGQMIRLIERLEVEGNRLKLPHSRVIGGGLFELRVGGKNIARSLYAYASGENIYLLRAFVKKTQTTPSNEIKIARKRLQELTK